MIDEYGLCGEDYYSIREHLMRMFWRRGVSFNDSTETVTVRVDEERGRRLLDVSISGVVTGPFPKFFDYDQDRGGWYEFRFDAKGRRRRLRRAGTVSTREAMGVGE